VARRPRTVPIASWRDGVHLTGTSLWCDARRRRDVCFASAADRVGRAGHGQLIATPATIALLGEAPGAHLAVPVHKPFTLGTHRLQLIPSGRGLGAASIHIDVGSHTVLYAGPIRPTNPREAAEVRACDAVIVEASVPPKQSFPELDDVASELLDWVRVELVAGRRPVIAVDNPLDAIEIAAHIASADIRVTGSSALRELARRAAALPPPPDRAASSKGTSRSSAKRPHDEVPELVIPTIRAVGREPSAMIVVNGDRVTPPPKAVHALASPRALESRAGDAVRFAWPFCADADELIEWIEQSRARSIYLTGAYADAVAELIGPRARVLGPPRQMALFG
jgi:hypothetical protein